MPLARDRKVTYFVDVLFRLSFIMQSCLVDVHLLDTAVCRCIMLE